MEWQPIATAPTDGTEILFCGTPSYPNLIRIGFYLNGYIFTGAFVKQPSAIPREWKDVATHWMPLPPTPETVT